MMPGTFQSPSMRAVPYGLPAAGCSGNSASRIAQDRGVEGCHDRHTARRPLGPDLSLLSEDDATQTAFRVAGGDGCISVTANVVPALCSALHVAYDEHRLPDIGRLDSLLMPLHTALFVDTNSIPLKRAVSPESDQRRGCAFRSRR